MSSPKASPVILYGGRFDPIHQGHLKLIDGALECMPNHLMIVVPTGNPWHKGTKATLQDRLAMCEASCEGLDHVEASALEPEDRPSYTIDTIDRLPSHRGVPVLLVGGDSLAAIDRWKRWRELLSRVSVAVVPRKPDDRWMPDNAEAARVVMDSLVESVEDLRTSAGRILVLRCDPPEISSERLRSMIAANEGGWEKMVPRQVVAYVRGNGLYAGTKGAYNLSE